MHLVQSRNMCWEALNPTPIPGLSIIHSVCRQFSVFKRLSTFSCPMTSGLAGIMANKHSVTWLGNLNPFYFLLKAELQPLGLRSRAQDHYGLKWRRGDPEILMELSCINLKGAAAGEKEGNPQEEKKKKRENDMSDERWLLRCEDECREGTGFSS